MFNVAILGFGVVGSGVLEVIEKNSDRIAKSAGQEVRVKYIVDIRDFSDSPYRDLFVKDFSVVENDPEVAVVVETIGGVGAAHDFTRRSLLAGKSVVTSNKELVATRGFELLGIAQEKGVNYLFEASVGGGIPIIRPLTQCLAANKINEIYGILNGTTNYILSEMIKNGVSREEALRDAQRKGYAEANPAADIEGHDACRKICILSAICFGRHVYPEQVPTSGIESITADDARLAGMLGYKIKLLGRAIARDDKISAYVAPHLVSGDNLLASVEGVMNGIVVSGNAIGDVMFYGAGAGKMPTASAVVADIIDAARHVHSRKPIGWDDGGDGTVFDSGILETMWYVRILGGRDAIPDAFGDVKFVGDESVGAFITGFLSKNKVEELLSGTSACTLLRVLD